MSDSKQQHRIQKISRNTDKMGGMARGSRNEMHEDQSESVQIKRKPTDQQSDISIHNQNQTKNRSQRQRPTPPQRTPRPIPLHTSHNRLSLHRYIPPPLTSNRGRINSINSRISDSSRTLMRKSRKGQLFSSFEDVVPDEVIFEEWVFCGVWCTAICWGECLLWMKIKRIRVS